jgi:hypothetical protein
LTKQSTWFPTNKATCQQQCILTSGAPGGTALHTPEVIKFQSHHWKQEQVCLINDKVNWHPPFRYTNVAWNA